MGTYEKDTYNFLIIFVKIGKFSALQLQRYLATLLSVFPGLTSHSINWQIKVIQVQLPLLVLSRKVNLQEPAIRLEQAE